MKRLAGVPFVLFLAIAAACGQSEELDPQASNLAPTPAGSEAAPGTLPTPSFGPVTAPSDWTRYRWGSVTLSAPADVLVVRQFAAPEENPPDGGQIIRLRTSVSEVVLDADDGRVLQKSIDARDEGTMTQVLGLLRVGETPVQPLPWPLGLDEPKVSKKSADRLLYIEPDPGSGIVMYKQCGDGADGVSCVLGIRNAYSKRSVDTKTGELVADAVAPDDLDAFNRWSAAVEVSKE
jgi:hypothetical protein